LTDLRQSTEAPCPTPSTPILDLLEWMGPDPPTPTCSRRGGRRVRACPCGKTPTTEGSSRVIMRRTRRARLGVRRRDGEPAEAPPTVAALTAGHDEDIHPRRLPRHATYARLLHEAVGARRRGLERSRPGRRRARRAIARDRSARAHSRAHRDPRGTPPSTAEAPAHQPAQRLPAHRCRRLYGPRGGRLVEHAPGDAVVRRRGAHLGARPRGNASASAAGRRPEGGDVAGRRRPHAPREDARRLRLRQNRQHGRRVREGVSG